MQGALLCWAQSSAKPQKCEGNSLDVQDHRFGGTWLERCSNVDFHGPYEQTWTAAELDFTQGTILHMDNSSTPNIATVQVKQHHIARDRSRTWAGLLADP